MDGDDHLLDEFVAQVRDELPQDEARRAYEVMAKILGNIVQNPTEAKFRSVKKASKALSLLTSCTAAASLLLLAGFEDQEEAYVFPEDADFGTSMALLDKLQNALLVVGLVEQMSLSLGTSSPASGSFSAPASPAGPDAAKPTRPVPEYQAPAASRKPATAFKFQASRSAAASASKSQEQASQSLAEIRQQRRQSYEESGGAAAVSSATASSLCRGPEEVGPGAAEDDSADAVGAAPAQGLRRALRSRGGLDPADWVPSWLPGASGAGDEQGRRGENPGAKVTPQSGDARTMKF